MTPQPIQITDKVDLIIEKILQISDSAENNPYPAFTREDVVAIGVKLFELACMSEYMTKPAVQVWHTARQSWFDAKDGE